MRNPKKYGRTVSAALCSLLILTSVPALADTYATVQGGGLNLRQTASTHAKVLGQYPTGTWITSSGCSGSCAPSVRPSKRKIIPERSRFMQTMR